MFGHDPDWTHHSSEDRIDKTYVSESSVWECSPVRVHTILRRPSRFQSYGDYTAASSIQIAEFAADCLQIEISEWRAGEWKLRGVAIQKLNSSVYIEKATSFRKPTILPMTRAGNPLALSTKVTLKWTQHSQSTGPHRRAALLLDVSGFVGVNAEDGKWLAEQEDRFSSDSEGLARKANFGLISFEGVIFMDGHRSTAEIAALLSAEYPLDIDQAWVDRTAGILEKQKR